MMTIRLTVSYNIIVTIRANDITSTVDIFMYIKFSCNGVHTQLKIKDV